MSKFLILTDSISNPRSFPISEMTKLEETYPYIIRDYYKDSTFWQLSYGDISSEQLFSQAIGYLSHWNPDIIIIQSGINDCKPEAFTEFQKTVINRFTGPLFRYIKRYVLHPKMIKHRQKYRVSKKSFMKSAKKIQVLYENSMILWLEISANVGYENARPGVRNRIKVYNKVIENIYSNDFIPINEKILKVDGFNKDSLHWNKRGHRAVADILLERINLHLNQE
tara:strand:+ start:491 stop:1162 length:672 start_codon:yes stop_codon:yes gene_type:complete